MIIKLLAKEVYKYQSQVHKLEDRLEHCSPQKRDQVLKELQIARSELHRARTMLESKKAAHLPSSGRSSFFSKKSL